MLFGVGEFAEVCYVYFEEDSDFNVVGFTVNQEYISEPDIFGKPVVPFEEVETYFPTNDFGMFVAVGYKRVNKARAEIYSACKGKGYQLVTYVSSRVTRFGNPKIGENCFIFENNVIQPYVEIGDNVIMWSGNHIGHHSRIGNHCFLASHAVISGNVTIGEFCFVGVNSTFRDGVNVAPDCVIGAGALILKDTKPAAVYAVKGTEVFPRKSSELKSFQ